MNRFIYLVLAVLLLACKVPENNPKGDYPYVGGDLSGTTQHATVTGIQGKPVPAPAVGALQYDGGSYYWGGSSGGGGGGLTTVLDLDFTANGNMAFPNDGTYSYAGMTWTKTNSASEIRGTSSSFVIPSASSNVSVSVTIGAGVAAYGVGFYVYFSDGTNTMMGKVVTNSGSNPITVQNQGWSGYTAPGNTMASSALATACAIAVSGTGLQLTPISSANWYASGRSSQFLQFPLTALFANWTFKTPTRIWVNESADNATTDYDSANITIENGVYTSYVNGYNATRGYYSATNGWLPQTQFNNNSSQTPNPGAPISVTANRTFGLDLPTGFQGQAVFFAGPTYSSGWTSPQSFWLLSNAWMQAGTSGVTNLSGIATGGYGYATNTIISFGSVRSGSTTALQIFYDHFRVDMITSIY